MNAKLKSGPISANELMAGLAKAKKLLKPSNSLTPNHKIVCSLGSTKNADLHQSKQS